jgi:dolichol-phosphate mannosyltransferase
MRALVIIPTYNEAENIAAIIAAVLPQDDSIEVLVVDDNSPDGTSKIVEGLQNPRVHLLKRPGKMGLGPAYVAGFKFALGNGFDRIIEMDADFSHPPATLPKMLALSGQNDLVIGSRYVCGINVVNWPLQRLILSYGASKYVQFITGMPVKDPTAGYNCYRREVLEAIDLDGILSDGYSFQIEMHFRAHLLGYRIKEMPIVFEDRRSGKSKMSKRIVREAIYMVWKLAWLNWTGRIPRRKRR